MAKGQVARSTLYLDRELWTAARKAAIDECLPVTRLVERLLREYLEKRKRRLKSRSRGFHLTDPQVLR